MRNKEQLFIRAILRNATSILAHSIKIHLSSITHSLLKKLSIEYRGRKEKTDEKALKIIRGSSYNTAEKRNLSTSRGRSISVR